VPSKRPPGRTDPASAVRSQYPRRAASAAHRHRRGALIAAFSTGATFLFFLVYLGILVIGGAYVVTRFGLADLEAGCALTG
jgi:hypothetical protein